eukprot:symbB.v1.2.011009.t1/scaffold687.1/size172701/15
MVRARSWPGAQINRSIPGLAHADSLHEMWGCCPFSGLSNIWCRKKQYGGAMCPCFVGPLFENAIERIITSERPWGWDAYVYLEGTTFSESSGKHFSRQHSGSLGHASLIPDHWRCELQKPHLAQVFPCGKTSGEDDVDASPARPVRPPILGRRSANREIYGCFCHFFPTPAVCRCHVDGILSVADEITCPFQSLAKGISHHYRYVEEKNIRSLLVETYHRLSGESFRTLADQKLKDETSFFHMTHFREVNQVKKYWNWYLYCLTFQSGEQLPREVVRVPLDYTDLKVLSKALSARFTVSTLDEQARCYCLKEEQPVNIHVHLVRHKSRWAPVLGRKMAVKGLENQLVALQALDGGPFQSFQHKGAEVIPNTNGEEKHYLVCVGRQILPMHRNQLQLVAVPKVDTSENSSVPWWRRWQGPALGEAPSFRGIPDGSVEFQLLLELLGDKIYKRLQQKREELKGYQIDDDRTNRNAASYTSALPLGWWESTPAATPAPVAAREPAPAQQRIFKTERRPLEEVITAIRQRRAQKLTCKIHLRSPTTFSREDDENWNSFLRLSRGMYYCLTGVKEDPHPKFSDPYLFKGFAEEAEEKKGWFIPDLLCIWEVRQAMTIPPSMKSTESTVELQTDECFYVTDLFDGGWAQVRQWTKSLSPKQGVLHLASARKEQRLRPMLCIQEGDLNNSLSSSSERNPGAALLFLATIFSEGLSFVSAPSGSQGLLARGTTVDSSIARKNYWRWVEPTVPEELVESAKEEGFRPGPGRFQVME